MQPLIATVSTPLEGVGDSYTQDVGQIRPSHGRIWPNSHSCISTGNLQLLAGAGFQPDMLLWATDLTKEGRRLLPLADRPTSLQDGLQSVAVRGHRQVSRGGYAKRPHSRDRTLLVTSSGVKLLQMLSLGLPGVVALLPWISLGFVRTSRLRSGCSTCFRFVL